MLYKLIETLNKFSYFQNFVKLDQEKNQICWVLQE